jgi:16S rRNA G966 N2-methylase RsmD
MVEESKTYDPLDVNDIYNYVNVRNLNKTLPQEEFDRIIDDLVDNMYNYGFDNIINDYNKKLNPTKDWVNLKKKKIEKNHISSTSTTGLTIMKKHMQHVYKVKNYKGKSIYNLWKKNIIKKALLTNRKSHSTPYITEIIRQIGFTSGTSKVTMYRPLLTKRIVQYFNAKNVLDVCVGWGGRLVGSVCNDGVHYTGIEPFNETFKKLNKIVDELGIQEHITLYNDCAENVLPQLEKQYDLALTSPPYYNLEIYTDEKSQSHHYGSYKEWKNKFLDVVIKGVLDKLVDTGKSCWSVKNFKTDKTYKLLDDVITIHKKYGWTKIDMEFYVGNCTRPGLKEKNGDIKRGKEITYAFECV